MRQPAGSSSISGFVHGSRQSSSTHADDEKQDKKQSQRKDGEEN